MTLATAERIPTLDDAHLAAEALREALNPGEVLLFGSVANGSQEAGSDLDLVLIFDDLGDYTERRDLVFQAKETIEQATGLSSDVRVTDRPEWKIRTTQCKSTFEAHIAKNAVNLISNSPKTTINWRKEIGMAPSDAQQAANSLQNTYHALIVLRSHLKPTDHETDSFLAGNIEYSDDCMHARMLKICAESQAVIESSLKALIHALQGPHPSNIHDIGGLMKAARKQLASNDAVQFKSCLVNVTPKQASVWRELGTYPGDAGIEGDPRDATPEFSSRMARSAVKTARRCIALITTELGYVPTDAQKALRECHRIDKDLQKYGFSP